MRCPKCKSDNSIVIKTESKFESFTFRYRKCKDCFVMWQTKELVIDGSAHRIDSEIMHESEDEVNLVNTIW